MDKCIPTSMEDAPPEEPQGSLEPTQPMKKDRTALFYWILLILTVVAMVIGWWDDNINSYPIAIPIIVILVASILFKDRMFMIPPILIALVVLSLFISLASDHFTGDKEFFKILRDICAGLILSICGVIVAYYTLRHTPDSNPDKKTMIGLTAFTFGLAAFSVYAVVYYALVWMTDGALKVNIDWNEFMEAMLVVAVVSLLVWIIYALDGKYKFLHRTAVNFFESNNVRLGKDPNQEVLDLIEAGESQNVEFKSTLRTNIHTGEKDKRMEAAVLKTLVAFLNSDGGDLLIGVKDDGEIVGMDVQTFDNRDKIYLHVTNMISIQVGDNFIPFIEYRLVDFEERTVLHFKVRRSSKPAFVKTGEVESFYARSGPASIELKGSELLKYFENHYKIKK